MRPVHIHVPFHYLTSGKFKGKANDFDLSLDDLVELLHSVDHHKVVDSRDAVISDEQLEALLDRTLTSQEKDKDKEPSTSSCLPEEGQNLFRVIEERDAKGNVIRGGDDSAPTTDTWHIVTETNTASVIENNTKSSTSDVLHPSCSVLSVPEKFTVSDSTPIGDGSCQVVTSATSDCKTTIHPPVSPTEVGREDEEDKTVHVSGETDSNSSELTTIAGGQSQAFVVPAQSSNESETKVDSKDSALCDSGTVSVENSKCKVPKGGAESTLSPLNIIMNEL